MKKRNSLNLTFLLFNLFAVILLNSCAPVFSEMQDARTVGKKNIDATASFSTVRVRNTESGEGSHLQNHVGAQASYGLTDGLDLRVRYSYVYTEDFQVSIVGIGPKFNLVKNRLAGYVPIGTSFGNVSDHQWQTHPTLIATFPVGEKLDINPSAKALIPLTEGSDVFAASNIGLGIKVINNFIIRPEFGVLFNLGDNSYISQFSLGVTYNPSRKTSTN